jgi:hypothetical protein
MDFLGAQTRLDLLLVLHPTSLLSRPDSSLSKHGQGMQLRRSVRLWMLPPSARSPRVFCFFSSHELTYIFSAPYLPS